MIWKILQVSYWLREDDRLSNTRKLLTRYCFFSRISEDMYWLQKRWKLSRLCRIFTCYLLFAWSLKDNENSKASHNLCHFCKKIARCCWCARISDQVYCLQESCNTYISSISRKFSIICEKFASYLSFRWILQDIYFLQDSLKISIILNII